MEEKKGVRFPRSQQATWKRLKVDSAQSFLGFSRGDSHGVDGAGLRRQCDGNRTHAEVSLSFSRISWSIHVENDRPS